MTAFRKALPLELADSFREGLQALKGGHRARVVCENPRCLTGSVDLDQALVSRRPAEPRWDYGIGIQNPQEKERAIWVEVHPAATSNVNEVINKFRWLQNWLKTEAPGLDRLTRGIAGETCFYWVATSGVNIRKGSPQAHQLAAAGLDFPRRQIQIA